MFEFLQTIPVATFFILALSTSLGLMSSLVQRRFVDVEKVRAVRKQMGELRKQMFEAKKKGDKKTLTKLQRRQMQIMKESSQVMGQQTKVMLFTMFPFLAIFWSLSVFFGSTAVAIAPFPIPYGAVSPPPDVDVSQWLESFPSWLRLFVESNQALPFWTWYFLSALSMNMPLNRIFKIYSY